MCGTLTGVWRQHLIFWAAVAKLPTLPTAARAALADVVVDTLAIDFARQVFERVDLDETTRIRLLSQPDRYQAASLLGCATATVAHVRAALAAGVAPGDVVDALADHPGLSRQPALLAATVRAAARVPLWAVPLVGDHWRTRRPLPPSLRAALARAALLNPLQGASDADDCPFLPSGLGGRARIAKDLLDGYPELREQLVADKRRGRRLAAALSGIDWDDTVPAEPPQAWREYTREWAEIKDRVAADRENVSGRFGDRRSTIVPGEAALDDHPAPGRVLADIAARLNEIDPEQRWKAQVDLTESRHADEAVLRMLPAVTVVRSQAPAALVAEIVVRVCAGQRVRWQVLRRHVDWPTPGSVAFGELLDHLATLDDRRHQRRGTDLTVLLLPAPADYRHCPACDLMVPTGCDTGHPDPHGCPLCSTRTVEAAFGPRHWRLRCPQCPTDMVFPEHATVIACHGCATHYRNPDNEKTASDQLNRRRNAHPDGLPVLIDSLTFHLDPATAERVRANHAGAPDSRMLGWLGARLHIRTPPGWINPDTPQAAVFRTAFINALSVLSRQNRRTVLQLRYGLDGLPSRTYRQIADALGHRSPSTARDLHWHALQIILGTAHVIGEHPDAGERACATMIDLATRVLDQAAASPGEPAQLHAFLGQALPGVPTRVGLDLLLQLHPGRLDAKTAPDLYRLRTTTRHKAVARS